MSTPTQTACTACGSTDTRLSRWRSHDERIGNPGLHPYRCGPCGHRFLARASTRAGRRKWPLVVAGGAALLVLGIVGATLFVVAGDEQAIDEAERIAAVAPTLEAARQGDHEAQFRLARAALLDPERGKEATREAVDWLRRAAEGGHTGAMIHLGKLYKSGVGTPQNYDLAAHWLGNAARAGDAEGMVEFGRLHRSGVGVEQDSVQAYVSVQPRRSGAEHGWCAGTRQRCDQARARGPEARAGAIARRRSSASGRRRCGHDAEGIRRTGKGPGARRIGKSIRTQRTASILPANTQP